ncbi:MAG TPA: metallophosphoesterase [Candidatus Goldiibacteriota bacterium]|nr:metallophosphoesterase [Candidatus Goldiibacteriota bacterium]
MPGQLSLNSGGVIMGPYLAAPSADGACVLVECEGTMPVAVEFGVTESYGNYAETESVEATGAGTYVHNLRMQGLPAGTSCHYRVTRGAAVSGDYVFKTAKLPGAAFRMAWASDFQKNTKKHAQISKKILEAGPDFCLYGGDIATFGTYDSIKSEFFTPEELALLSVTPFFFTVGNHEGWGTASRAFYQAPETASGRQDCYSFDYGDMHVLVLNAEDRMDPSSGQYTFASADLAASAAKWKLISVHHPYYSGNGPDYVPFDSAGLARIIEDIAVPQGVDMVLSGHIHNYQHNLINGIHHMIIATAGGDLDLAAPVGGYTLNSVSSYCYGIFDADSVSLTLNVYNENGFKIDGFFLH